MKKKYLNWIWILIGLFVFAGLLRYLVPLLLGYDIFPYYGHMMGGWGFPLSMFGMGIFWIVIIILAFQYFTKEDKESNDDIVILKRRLSKGEITIDEFEHLKEVLGKDK